MPDPQTLRDAQTVIYEASLLHVKKTAIDMTVDRCVYPMFHLSGAESALTEKRRLIRAALADRFARVTANPAPASALVRSVFMLFGFADDIDLNGAILLLKDMSDYTPKDWMFYVNGLRYYADIQRILAGKSALKRPKPFSAYGCDNNNPIALLGLYEYHTAKNSRFIRTDMIITKAFGALDRIDYYGVPGFHDFFAERINFFFNCESFLTGYSPWPALSERFWLGNEFAAKTCAELICGNRFLKNNKAVAPYKEDGATAVLFGYLGAARYFADTDPDAQARDGNAFFNEYICAKLNPGGALRYGKICVKAHYDLTAALWFKRIISRNETTTAEDQIEARREYSYLMLKNGRSDEAMDTLREIKDKPFEVIEQMWNTIRTSADAQKLEEAETLAMFIAPKNMEAAVWLYERLFSREEYDEAFKILSNTDVNARNERVNMLLASCYVHGTGVKADGFTALKYIDEVKKNISTDNPAIRQSAYVLSAFISPDTGENTFNIMPLDEKIWFRFLAATRGSSKVESFFDTFFEDADVDRYFSYINIQNQKSCFTSLIKIAALPLLYCCNALNAEKNNELRSFITNVLNGNVSDYSAANADYNKYRKLAAVLWNFYVGESNNLSKSANRRHFRRVMSEKNILKFALPEINRLFHRLIYLLADHYDEFKEMFQRSKERITWIPELIDTIEAIKIRQEAFRNKKDDEYFFQQKMKRASALGDAEAHCAMYSRMPAAASNEALEYLNTAVRCRQGRACLYKAYLIETGITEKTDDDIFLYINALRQNDPLAASYAEHYIKTFANARERKQLKNPLHEYSRQNGGGESP
jgi:hypothetical protein